MSMNEYQEDIHYMPEADYEYLQADSNYLAKRKSSFIDLLSYGKINCESITGELSNIELLLNDSFKPDDQHYITDIEPVKLLLDEFPDINCNQKHCISLDGQYKTYIATLNKTYNNEFIGTLTAEERRKKIERYLAKKMKRTWKKKIHYDCRKKVADNRLRIKGRFVTRNKHITLINDQENKKVETNIN